MKEIPVNPYFYGQYRRENGHLSMRLCFTTSVFSTKALPGIVTHVSSCLPTIMESRCFNDQNLPFSQEIWNTELGHLFEHILLESLSLFKAEQFGAYEKVSGVTSWDWIDDTRGSFHIDIKTGFVTESIVDTAIEDSVLILTQALETSLTTRPMEDLIRE